MKNSIKKIINCSVFAVMVGSVNHVQGAAKDPIDITSFQPEKVKSNVNDVVRMVSFDSSVIDYNHKVLTIPLLAKSSKRVKPAELGSLSHQDSFDEMYAFFREDKVSCSFSIPSPSGISPEDLDEEELKESNVFDYLSSPEQSGLPTH